MTQNNPDALRHAILTLMQQFVARMKPLGSEGRITLLSGLLAQELCNLPPAERDGEMARLLRDFPAIMAATQEGMRSALVENARNGL